MKRIEITVGKPHRRKEKRIDCEDGNGSLFLLFVSAIFILIKKRGTPPP